MHLSEAGELVALLKDHGLTMSAAESCTGGLIGASVTDIPGASAVFMGSAVTYSNEAKMSLLGVRESTIAEHGAVSSETAREMVAGAQRIFGSDVAVAVTGIAGPGGATGGKPVGLVHFAVADGPRIVTMHRVFAGSR